MDPTKQHWGTTFYTFSIPTKEPPDRETAWKKLNDKFCFPPPLTFNIHDYLQQLKAAGKISQYAVVELVVENQ